jgi:hypothetical protein
MAPTLPTASPPEFHNEQQLVVARDHELLTIDLRFALDHEPYDCARTISYGRAAVTMEAQSILVIGRACLLLKEHESPEQFAACVAQIGISERSARNYMAATLRFGSEARKLATANLSASKLIELAHEPDEDIDALLEGGTVANQTLDQIERMSVRELREAIREARKDKAAIDEIVREKDERINTLTKSRRRIERSGARVQADELLTDMDAAAVEAASAIRVLRDTASSIRCLYQDAGESLDEEVIARIEQNLDLARGWAADLAEELAK